MTCEAAFVTFQAVGLNHTFRLIELFFSLNIYLVEVFSNLIILPAKNGKFFVAECPIFCGSPCVVYRA